MEAANQMVADSNAQITEQLLHQLEIEGGLQETVELPEITDVMPVQKMTETTPQMVKLPVHFNNTAFNPVPNSRAWEARSTRCN